jgi:Glycosyl hydrolases family 28
MSRFNFSSRSFMLWTPLLSVTNPTVTSFSVGFHYWPSICSIPHTCQAVADDPNSIDANHEMYCFGVLVKGGGEDCRPRNEDDDDDGEIPQRDDDEDIIGDRAWNNTLAFNRAILAVGRGDTVLVPDGKAFTVFGGIVATNLDHWTLDVAGSLHFVYDTQRWPIHASPSTYFGNTYDPGIAIVNCTNVTVTSSSRTLARVEVDFARYVVRLVNATRNRGGIMNGYGKRWWDDVIAGRIHERVVTRPRLLHFIECEDVLVEKLTLVNSPYWTLTVEAVRAEVRYINVLVDRELQGRLLARNGNKGRNKRDNVSSSLGPPTSQKRVLPSSPSENDGVGFPIPIDDLPDWVAERFRQPQDLNTDGIDPIGQDITVHNCVVQNADDSIAVKPSHRGRNGTRIPDCTNNVTIHDVVLTGFGASIGSVGPISQHNCVDNIRFSNVSMPGTAKGIYVKSNGATCVNQSSQLTNILFENFDIIEPFWWPIWIGPQQQHQPAESLGNDVSAFFPCLANKRSCAHFPFALPANSQSSSLLPSFVRAWNTPKVPLGLAPSWIQNLSHAGLCDVRKHHLAQYQNFSSTHLPRW